MHVSHVAHYSIHTIVGACHSARDPIDCMTYSSTGFTLRIQRLEGAKRKLARLACWPMYSCTVLVRAARPPTAGRTPRRARARRRPPAARGGTYVVTHAPWVRRSLCAATAAS
jgi:hypothetical protein